MLYQDYNNFEEFVESFQISLSNSEGFSESSYRTIRSLVDHSEDTEQRIENTITARDATRELSAQSTITVIDDHPKEVIDLTNDSEIEGAPNITIDIHRETGRQKKSKNRGNHSNIVRSQNRFIDITSEGIVNHNKRKKKKTSS